MVLEFLLRHAARTGSPNASGMADRTLRAMARGGIYDQLGGGFARYSVDRDWVVPHFEKMLYDNAQLLGVYVRWWRQSGDPSASGWRRETADFLLRELRTAAGRLRLRAGRRHRGGRGPVLRLDPGPAGRGARRRGRGLGGGAAAGDTGRAPSSTAASTLQLPVDPDDAARWASVRGAASPRAATRVRPARDDKVVAAWNGLAVASLAEAGMLLGEPAYVDAAVVAARLLVDLHVEGRRLLRVSRDGVAGRHAGVLEDYACVAARAARAALRDRRRDLAAHRR